MIRREAPTPTVRTLALVTRQNDRAHRRLVDIPGSIPLYIDGCRFRQAKHAIDGCRRNARGCSSSASRAGWAEAPGPRLASGFISSAGRPTREAHRGRMAATFRRARRRQRPATSGATRSACSSVVSGRVSRFSCATTGQRMLTRGDLRRTASRRPVWAGGQKKGRRAVSAAGDAVRGSESSESRAGPVMDARLWPAAGLTAAAAVAAAAETG